MNKYNKINNYNDHTLNVLHFLCFEISIRSTYIEFRVLFLRFLTENFKFS